MARGITYFSGFWKRHTPGGTMYGCTLCSFQLIRQRGNALGAHNRVVAIIKKHREEKHPDQPDE